MRFEVAWDWENENCVTIEGRQSTFSYTAFSIWLYLRYCDLYETRAILIEIKLMEWRKIPDDGKSDKVIRMEWRKNDRKWKK
jgi:hypothetical protein